ncbi:MAG: hypothetical protein DWQ58_13075 [Microcystis aeruginosa TA09]|nr:MAG: hypothetical protein DWQ58_13075 [Microcystis aeruginosa TA09]
MLNKSKNLESASDWSDWGENSGTFSLKMGKTPHPTPHTLPPGKTFSANPKYCLERPILS